MLSFPAQNYRVNQMLASCFPLSSLLKYDEYPLKQAQPSKKLRFVTRNTFLRAILHAKFPARILLGCCAVCLPIQQPAAKGILLLPINTSLIVATASSGHLVFLCGRLLVINHHWIGKDNTKVVSTTTIINTTNRAIEKCQKIHLMLEGMPLPTAEQEAKLRFLVIQLM